MDRQGVTLGKEGSKWNAVPVEEGRFDNRSFIIDDAGTANADAEGRSRCFGQQLVDHLDELVDALLTLQRIPGSFGAVGGCSQQIEHRSGSFSIAEVNADDAVSAGVDAEQGWGLAARRRSGAQLEDQSLVLEFGDDCRHGGCGQTG